MGEGAEAAEAEVVVVVVAVAAVAEAVMVVARHSMAAASDQAAPRFTPVVVEAVVALHFQAARFTGAWPSTAVACDSLTGITFIGGSSMERRTPITTTTPITTPTAAARSSGPITVHAASVISGTGVTIIGVTIAGTITTIGSMGERPTGIAETSRAPQGARFAFCAGRKPSRSVFERRGWRFA